MTKPIQLDNEAQVQELLEKLEKGQEVKVEVGGEVVTYINPAEPTKICDKHYFEYAGDEGNGFVSYLCKNCINGRIINPKTQKVVNGEIKEK